MSTVYNISNYKYSTLSREIHNLNLKAFSYVYTLYKKFSTNNYYSIILQYGDII